MGGSAGTRSGQVSLFAVPALLMVAALFIVDAAPEMNHQGVKEAVKDVPGWAAEAAAEALKSDESLGGLGGSVRAGRQYIPFCTECRCFECCPDCGQLKIEEIPLDNLADVIE